MSQSRVLKVCARERNAGNLYTYDNFGMKEKHAPAAFCGK